MLTSKWVFDGKERGGDNQAVREQLVDVVEVWFAKCGRSLLPRHFISHFTRVSRYTTQVVATENAFAALKAGLFAQVTSHKRLVENRCRRMEASSPGVKAMLEVTVAMSKSSC